MTIEFDDQRILATPEGAAAGSPTEIRWDDLAGFDIETNDLGPFDSDVFWVLHARELPRALVFAQDATDTGPLLERLQDLEGFDNEAFIQSMASTEVAVFEIWRRQAA